MLTLVYHIALGTIVIAALWLALEPDVETGWLGSLCLGGIAVFSLAGTETSPPNWLVGQTVSTAGACVYWIARHCWRRRCVRRRLKGACK